MIVDFVPNEDDSCLLIHFTAVDGEDVCIDGGCGLSNEDLWQAAKDMGMTSSPSSWPSPRGLLSPSSLSHAFATSSVRLSEYNCQFSSGMKGLKGDVLLHFQVLEVSNEA